MSHGSLTAGKPYDGSPLENLTLSDPRCNNDSCKQFYDAHQLSQKLVSYNHQFQYDHYVSWYLVIVVGLFSASYWVAKYDEYRARNNCSKRRTNFVNVKDKLVAAWRLIAYKRARGWLADRAGLPSQGLLIFFGFAILYCCLLTFIERPYYRQHRGYGSPPLGVRTGLMAVALTPWIVALSGKANLITLLTGIGYEKLNVVHRWMSWLCLGLSVTHTIPFIVAPLKDGGPAQLHRQFYKPGGLEYTGTPPLAVLFGLVVLSLPWLRHRIYEAFYHLHFWLAVSYIGLMFWHCKDLGDSWTYMWVTLGVFLFSIVGRLFWYNRSTNLGHPMFMTSRVTATQMPDEMIQLEIECPTGFKWRTGQHVYIRFPGFAPWDNHPFTICNTLDSSIPEERRILRLLVRPSKGFTRRIHDYLLSSDKGVVNAAGLQLRGCLDGPYGSHHDDVFIRYDILTLVAGGGGISGILPLLHAFALIRRQGLPCRVSRVRVLWSIRHIEALQWVADSLQEIGIGTMHEDVDFTVHVTGSSDMAANSGNIADEKCPRAIDMNAVGSEGGRAGTSAFTAFSEEARPMSEIFVSKSACPTHGQAIPTTRALFSNFKVEKGRISLTPSLFTLASSPKSSHSCPSPTPYKGQQLSSGRWILVVACGPLSLTTDISNCLSRAQRTILRTGSNGNSKLAEVALRTEVFGW